MAGGSARAADGRAAERVPDVRREAVDALAGRGRSADEAGGNDWREPARRDEATPEAADPGRGTEPDGAFTRLIEYEWDSVLLQARTADGRPGA
jgi:hypothetical protein